MRIVHEIYAKTEAAVSGTPYTTKSGEPPNDWKAQVAIMCRNPTLPIPDVIEIEASGRCLIDALERVLESLKAIDADLVEAKHVSVWTPGELPSIG